MSITIPVGDYPGPSLQTTIHVDRISQPSDFTVDSDPLLALRDTRQRLAEELEAKLVSITELEAELSNLRRQRDDLRDHLRRLDIALKGPRQRKEPKA